MLLPDRIREVREAKHLTQAEVASKFDISASAYGQMERNADKCSFVTLCKIAYAIEVSLLFLVDVDNLKILEEIYRL